MSVPLLTCIANRISGLQEKSDELNEHDLAA